MSNTTINNTEELKQAAKEMLDLICNLKQKN